MELLLEFVDRADFGDVQTQDDHQPSDHGDSLKVSSKMRNGSQYTHNEI